jgi:hypothetical protein
LNPYKKGVLKRCEFDENRDAYVNSLSEDQFQSVVKTYHLNKKNKSYNDLLDISDPKKRTIFVKYILDNTFDIEVNTRKSKIRVYFDFNRWKNVCTKYSIPDLTVNHPSSCLIVDT